MSTGRSSSPGPVRWWPAALILVLMAILLAVFWLGDARSAQHRVIPTFPILFFGVLFLLIWAAFFSRLERRVRMRILAVTLALAGLGAVLFEIQGVTGNLVPILGLRWGGGRVFDTASRDAGVTAPGPHDYPQFYGPDRNAMLSGPTLARNWKTSPPREVWRRDVGEGWSSFAIVGTAAVTMEQRGDSEVVVRYALESGEQIWAHSDPAPFNTTVGGSGPRATPTVADGRVYTLGATGLLSCLELRDGTLVWQRDILKENDTAVPPWGMASSPLIADGLVVVQLGFSGRALVAHDRLTGEPVWKAEVESGSYSSPILAEFHGVPQIVMVNGASVTGHDPATGEVLWKEAWSSSGERVAPPLLMGENRMLISAGYGVGARLIDVERTEGRFSTRILWETRRLKSKFAPMVRHDGTVYGLDDGILVAIDPATGERHWKKGRYGHGQLLLVDDLLLIVTEKGDIALVEANPDEHLELGRFHAFDGKTWNPPALSGRRLLVRNNREAACYQLPAAD